MTWLAFVAGAVLSWGVYGAMLHQGQVRLGSPMRALLCVGVAYFLVGVVVPVITLFAQGQGLRGFTAAGTTAATVAGTLGALGAVCIIFSFRTGGTPTYVMPLVFGGAPLVNVLYTMATHPPKPPRARCCTSASWSPPSAPAWCSTSSRRRDDNCPTCYVPRAQVRRALVLRAACKCDVRRWQVDAHRRTQHGHEHVARWHVHRGTLHVVS